MSTSNERGAWITTVLPPLKPSMHTLPPLLQKIYKLPYICKYGRIACDINEIEDWAVDEPCFSNCLLPIVHIQSWSRIISLLIKISQKFTIKRKQIEPNKTTTNEQY